MRANRESCSRLSGAWSPTNEVSSMPNTQEKAPLRSRDEVPEGPARFSLAILALVNLAILATLLYSVYLGFSGDS